MDDELKYRLENSSGRAEYRQRMKSKDETYARIIQYAKENKKMSLTATVKKREGSPEFVIGTFGFKAEDLVNYCNSKGYINFDLLKGKEGGEYVKVSDYGVETSN